MADWRSWIHRRFEGEAPKQNGDPASASETDPRFHKADARFLRDLAESQGEERCKRCGGTQRLPLAPGFHPDHALHCPDCKDGEEEAWPPEVWVARRQHEYEIARSGPIYPIRRYIPATSDKGSA
jgi:hypothetical protein